VSSTEISTAIASANYHEAHFGEAFEIRTSNGSPAHSACIGFGLERITLALVKRHGTKVEQWPSDLTSKLWP
jgi:seryl-tRNA synthetase